MKLHLIILKDFKNAKRTSLYIFQKAVDCKLPLLRRCHLELASSVKIFVLIVQLNSTKLLRRMNLVIETFLK